MHGASAVERAGGSGRVGMTRPKGIENRALGRRCRARKSRSCYGTRPLRATRLRRPLRERDSRCHWRTWKDSARSLRRLTWTRRRCALASTIGRGARCGSSADRNVGSRRARGSVRRRRSRVARAERHRVALRRHRARRCRGRAFCSSTAAAPIGRSQAARALSSARGAARRRRPVLTRRRRAGPDARAHSLRGTRGASRPGPSRTPARAGDTAARTAWRVLGSVVPCRACAHRRPKSTASLRASLERR